MKHSALIKNTTLLLFNKISVVLSSFVLLPVFTASFTASEYGLVSLMTGYISLLAPFLMLRLDVGIFKHIVEVRDDVEKIKTIVSSSMQILFYLALILLCLATVVSFIFDVPFYLLMIANIISSILFTIVAQFARGVGRTYDFVFVSVIVTLLSFILSLYGVLGLNLGVEIIFISSIISQLIGAICLGIKTRVHGYISWRQIDTDIQRRLIKYSLPLVPDSVSFWVINISDRTILSIFLGVASAGTYTVANKFSSIIDQAVGVFFQAWTESAAVYAKKGNKDELYSEVFSSYMRVFITIPILITSALPFVFTLFVKGADFQSAYIYVPILMYAMIAHAAEAFISSIYLANDLTKQIAKTTIIGASINIVMNVMLVLFMGIWAAAVSTLVSYVITAIYRYYDVRKHGIHLRIESKLVILGVLIVLFNMFFYYWNNPIGNLVSFTVAFAVTLLLNVKPIMSGWSALRRNRI